MNKQPQTWRNTRKKYCIDCVNCKADYNYYYCGLSGAIVLENDLATHEPECTAWKFNPDL